MNHLDPQEWKNNPPRLPANDEWQLIAWMDFKSSLPANLRADRQLDRSTSTTLDQQTNPSFTLNHQLP